MPRQRRPSPDRYHDRVARIYDSIYEGDAYWKLYREITWGHLKPLLPREAGSRILDAGGGTGLWAVRLARSGFHVTLADTSRGMLEAARRNAVRAAVEDRVELVCEDIAGLESLTSEGYDLALALGDPLSFCSSAEAGAAALFRVLKPGAACVASVDGKYGALDHFVQAGDMDGLEEFVRTGRTEWLAKREAERFPVRTFAPAELRRLFAAAGFIIESLIGKTVLPLRGMRDRLDDRALYVRMLRLERRLHGEEALLGRAAHLQVAVRRPPA